MPQLSDNNAIAKYKLKDALPNTSIARSKICTFNTPSKKLRKMTPLPKAHTKVGSSQLVPRDTSVMKLPKAKQAANKPKVLIALSAVIKRVLFGYSKGT